MKTVIIVESPAKARKIQSFFKDGTLCTSSFGHIMDLPKKQISIDIENNFSPDYKPIDGKSKIIKELKRYSKGYRVLLAADDDREGDAIAWHCGRAMNVDFTSKNRIIFHEISKTAIDLAINNVHSLNMDSVNAQQGRRVLDRLVGYSLSPLLWKHIKTQQSGLSAGRVQSTLLHILQENEKNIMNHEKSSTMNYDASFTGKPSGKLILTDSGETCTNTILELLKKDREYDISKQYHTEDKKYSAHPFITSSLQQSAQSELGFSVKRTMDIAQKLYENGKITYMRTDSSNISPEFQDSLKHYISEKYGSDYFLRKNPPKKKKGAQEAHECIRVTSMIENLNDKYCAVDKKLYELIRKRTITSHMKPAIYDNLICELTNDTLREIGYFRIQYKVLLYDGYLRYSQSDLEMVEPLDYLPLEKYYLENCLCTESVSTGPQYPNESWIVRKLEKSGIGRPSTYASLIATLYNRNYTEVKNIPGQEICSSATLLDENNNIIIKETKTIGKEQKQRIVLTDLGKQVLEYLMLHFSVIINVEFTSLVEEDLDRVSLGLIEWQQVVKKVYDSFKDNLIIQRELRNLSSRSDSQSEMIELGHYKDEPVILKNGKFGPYVIYLEKNRSLSYYLKENPTDYENITIEMIKDIIEYPLCVGKHGRKNIMIHIGPYGKYMKYNNRNYRIPQLEHYDLETCVSHL
jgi:DNA topoisomerase-1|tara:strand:- start:1040 stop:3112 length:2073 start_codon:yes stop_codon:yes gene_type:complete